VNFIYVFEKLKHTGNGKTTIKKIGCKKNSSGLVFLGPTGIIGIFLNKPIKGKKIKIKSFNIHISKESYEPTQKFRIHLFNGNNNIFPGQDILCENVYLKGGTNGGWVNIDLSRYDIEFPDEGVIASIECLGSKRSNVIYLENIKKIKENKGEKLEVDWLKDIIISAGNKTINCNEKYIVWSKRGIGDWKKVDSISNYFTYPSIYLTVEIQE